MPLIMFLDVPPHALRAAIEVDQLLLSAADRGIRVGILLNRDALIENGRRKTFASQDRLL